MELFGIRLVGINEANGQKLLMTLLAIAVVLFLKWFFSTALRQIFGTKENLKVRFWSRQGLNLFSALVIVFAFLSIWFDDPTRLATGLGLVTAGLAFALQKVVTSFAGYLIIMRGNTFSVGERITIGGVRGDVIALGFLQTTILEMGQPPAVQSAPPAMWVQGRQFTGRIVTVTNDKVFETPVYNFTRDFPFIWEEMAIPIRYEADRDLGERLIMEAVQKHTQRPEEISEDDLRRLQRKYAICVTDMSPTVFYRITDNWLELSARFIVPEHGIRMIKDKIAREILKAFDQHGIQIASTTFELVAIPPVRFQTEALGQAKGTGNSAHEKNLS